MSHTNDTPSESPESKTARSRRDAILLSLGGAVALTAAGSINAIDDPMKRAGMALGALLLVFVLGLFSSVPRRKR